MITNRNINGIAPSTRLMLAMFSLIADINTDFGRGMISVLKMMYPDQTIDANPQGIGSMMVNIARKQVQYNEDRAYDVIQGWLMDIIPWKDKMSKKEPTKTHGEVFISKFPKWQDGLKAWYSNIKNRAISESIGKVRSKKKYPSIDKSFGKRPEGGGAPEGGEARAPTDPESCMGLPADEKAALRDFYDVIDVHMHDLVKSLSPKTRKLFDIIYEDNIGTFTSDIKANMGQASALKEKHLDLYESFLNSVDYDPKKAKRWSGFVGDLRKELVEEILDYVDKSMKPESVAILRSIFFGDADPTAIRKQERSQVRGKLDYQRGIDERKIAHLKWKEQDGTITPGEKKSLTSLIKKLTNEKLGDERKIAELEAKSMNKKQILTPAEEEMLTTLKQKLEDQVDVNAIQPVQPKEKKPKVVGDPEEAQEEAQAQMASIVASRYTIPLWA